MFVSSELLLHPVNLYVNLSLLINVLSLYIFWQSLARLNLPMLLMRGMMTKFMLKSIFGEPNDYTLEKFGKPDGKNGDSWS